MCHSSMYIGLMPRYIMALEGGLVSSQFVYSTPYNDMARYNTVYSRLVNLYGLPVSYNNAGTTLSASWFGQNGRFVSLNFSPQYTSGGQMHYFTTLSFEIKYYRTGKVNNYRNIINAGIV